MKARLATVIGKFVYGEYEADDKVHAEKRCRAAVGKISWEEIHDGGDYQCDECGKMFKPDTSGYRWDTPSGRLEPGCLFWNHDLPEDYYWDNHKGPHLYAMLPNGHQWNIDSRASNCRRQNDRNTRCWRRTGTPPNVHTSDCGCGAGAGSIYSNQGSPDEWHGYLHHGEFHT